MRTPWWWSQNNWDQGRAIGATARVSTGACRTASWRKPKRARLIRKKFTVALPAQRPRRLLRRRPDDEQIALGPAQRESSRSHLGFVSPGRIPDSGRIALLFPHGGR